MLLALTAGLVVVSIIGRVVLGRPVAGDFEIVAICTAICIFLCLPYCQLQRGNVVVNLFFRDQDRRVTRTLDALAAFVYALIALVFAWRMVFGLLDAVRDGDISMIIGIPLWWAYPPAIASFLLLAASCVTTAIGELEDEIR